MKKSILLAGLAAVAICFGACDKSGAGSASDGLADTVAQSFGNTQGSYYANMFNENMPDDVKAKFNEESFLRGLKQVMLADTADEGYLVGLSMGLQLMQTVNMWTNQAELNINREALYNAFANGFKHPMDQEAQEAANLELQQVMNKVSDRIRTIYEQRQQAEQEASAATATENKTAGAAYVEEQKAQDADLKTTESGLTYKVIKQGEGALPGDNDQVKVIYTGKLIDGTEFDSSKGEGIDFPVSGVVPGFREGLKMMNKGSKYTLIIPSDLAYGDQTNGSIPAGSTLVFDVEVVEVIPAN